MNAPEREIASPESRLREAVKQIKIARQDLSDAQSLVHPKALGELREAEIVVRGVTDGLEEATEARLEDR